MYRIGISSSVLVIAATIPVDLRAPERMEIYKAKSAGIGITSGTTPFQNGNDRFLRTEKVSGNIFFDISFSWGCLTWSFNRDLTSN